MQFLLGPFQDLNESPALVLGHWPGFHDLDDITNIAGVILIMSLVVLVTTDELLVHGMPEAALHIHHDCLVHLVGNHASDAGLSTRSNFFCLFNLFWLF